MRQAIETKFLGPTNHRGARVKAKACAGSVTVEWAYNLNPDQNHAVAARELAKKYDWHGYWVAGGKTDHEGNAYVLAWYQRGGEKRPLSEYEQDAIQRGDAFFIDRNEVQP